MLSQFSEIILKTAKMVELVTMSQSEMRTVQRVVIHVMVRSPNSQNVLNIYPRRRNFFSHSGETFLFEDFHVGNSSNNNN